MVESTAFILLIIRIISVYYLYGVIKKQLDLMKRPIDPEITGYRKSLLWLTVGLAGSNIIPIVFDVTVFLRELGILSILTLQPILIAYTASNALAALLAVFILARIYRDAVLVDETHKQSDHTLMND